MQSRVSGTRARRHAVLATASGLAVALVMALVEDKGWMFRASVATAYVGLVLLGVSLVLGPINVLRHRPNPVSSNLRRDVGIWAGLVALVHVIVGLQVHLQGRMLEYFLWPGAQQRVLPFRLDPFGISNYAGLMAGIVLLVLLMLSNSVSLRWMGVGRWKAVQRLNYVAAGLVVIHGVIYQVREGRGWGWIAVSGVLVLVVLAVQLAGARRVVARAKGG